MHSLIYLNTILNFYFSPYNLYFMKVKSILIFPTVKVSLGADTYFHKVIIKYTLVKNSDRITKCLYNNTY